ncbi:sortase family protein [Clostridium homopropionicum DSM 5847]|uniref:Sortase family protein n=1 Tax=Clostridium homopropionicum DSM 5847 TaxID=1121318 RepID=A0A0L6ZEN1_9CLOT|nr:class D sortase [Clostridium homopropionicum]KOA21435.1 sortase family protein [Clostridium homopropionicum DSM 5847]SFG09973.1 sortase A [Clostridium homopropionicum]
MKRVIGIIMILAGACLIITINYTKYRVDKNQKEMINAFENIIKDEVNNDKPVNKVEIKVPENKLEINTKDTIGILYIPKIDIKVAIAEGVDNETLKYAVGHFKGTPLPDNKGNFCIAGHRSYAYGEFFNRLDELQIDDEITVETKVRQYKYRVYEKKVVEPSEISVLDNTKDPIITLVTCTPVRIATHRLIIKGKLEE